MAEEIEPKKKIIIKDIMSLEDYKKQVFDCLKKYQNCSTPEAKKLMSEYEEDLPGFYEENYEPEVAACGMAMHYL